MAPSSATSSSVSSASAATTTTVSQRFASTIYSDFTTTIPTTTTTTKRRLIIPRIVSSEEDNSTRQEIIWPSSMTNTVLSSPVGASSSTPRLSKMDMPKHGPSPQELENAIFFMSLEIAIGRGAMLAAVVFVAMELSTGMSLAEQMSRVCS